MTTKKAKIAKRALIFGSNFSVSLQTFTVTCQEHDVQSCSIANHEHHPAELCRCCPIFLKDRGVWDRRSCLRNFHHQRLQSWHRCASQTPEHSTPVSPRVLEHPRSRLAFRAAVCPYRLPSSVTRAVELVLPARVLQARLLLAVCSEPVQLANQCSTWSISPAPS